MVEITVGGKLYVFPALYDRSQTTKNTEDQSLRTEERGQRSEDRGIMTEELGQVTDDKTLITVP